jgi:glutamate 5-kinase
MRNFANIKKVVIKIGTNTISKLGAIEIDTDVINNIAKQIIDLRNKDIQVVIVTSGAIGMGAGKLGIREVTDPRKRQACAAIGQPLLMEAYNKAFSRYKVITAQVLLTSDVLNRRVTYENLRNAVDELLALKTLPILNENDSVSTEEIGSAFGDNDKLSALVASKIEADLLIMLTDVDALYDRKPQELGAKPIKTVETLTDEIMSCAGQSGSRYATGGMKTKIAAVKIAFNAGCRIVIARGRESNILNRILAGEDIGTVFVPKGIEKRDYWDRWLLNRPSEGNIKAKDIWQKIKRQQDLLPRDVLEVEGNFAKETVIVINNIFKAITQLSSEDIRLLAGKTQGTIKKERGHGDYIVARYQDIVEIQPK